MFIGTLLVKFAIITRGGGHLNVKRGDQARPKIYVKSVCLHNPALYVCNVDRVSNSCKIGLKGGDFFGDFTHLRLFFMQSLCKSVIFLDIVRT